MKSLSRIIFNLNSLSNGLKVNKIAYSSTAAYFHNSALSFQHDLIINHSLNRQHCRCLKDEASLLNNTQSKKFLVPARCFTTPAASNSEPPQQNEPKPSLYQRFKSMYRDYWYVLIPVHVVTSVAWFGGFYYIATSGVDIVSFLEQFNVSEKVINPLRNGKTGYIAISYALYKIATPVRYTVTLGGTTISINYLKQWGYIKPVPSKEKLKELYEDKKVILKERGQTLKENMMQSLKPNENN